MTWKTLTTEQKTHLIKSVWRDDITSQQIGDAVGASKGAITGHYFRNRSELAEFPLMISGIQKHKEGKLAPSTLLKQARENRVEEEVEEREDIYVPRAPKTPNLKKVGVPDTSYPAALNVTLFENTGCMWPVNDGGPYLFCGHDKAHGSYCQHHHARSLGRGTEGERRALSVLRAKG